MRIIISPAKKMQEDTDYYSFHDYPVFLQKTEILLDWIKELSFSEQKKLWACNDIIARQNSPFRGKLIQTHDEPRLNPKSVWVRYRWVQMGTRLRIQTEKRNTAP